jgi:hypothetical protein
MAITNPKANTQTGQALKPSAYEPFVQPGQVAPDRPAPDASMRCGRPESDHRAGPFETEGQCPHQVAMSAEEAIVTAYLHARDCLGEPMSQRQLSATFGVPRPKVATLVGTLNGTRPNDAEEDVTERVSPR